MEQLQNISLHYRFQFQIVNMRMSYNKRYKYIWSENLNMKNWLFHMEIYSKDISRCIFADNAECWNN